MKDVVEQRPAAVRLYLQSCAKTSAYVLVTRRTMSQLELFFRPRGARPRAPFPLLSRSAARTSSWSSPHCGGGGASAARRSATFRRRCAARDSVTIVKADGIEFWGAASRVTAARRLKLKASTFSFWFCTLPFLGGTYRRFVPPRCAIPTTLFQAAPPPTQHALASSRPLTRRRGTGSGAAASTR